MPGVLAGGSSDVPALRAPSICQRLRTLLSRTQEVLRADADRERENKRKQIAQNHRGHGEGLTIVMECLDSLLAQLLAREELTAAMKQDPEAQSL